MSLAESILEDTFSVRRRPALLAGRARNALAVGHGPPAESCPARRADHLRAEGPPEERAGRVHPRLAGIPGLSAKPLEALDALIAEIEAAVTSTRRIARLAGLPRLRPARA